LLALHSFELIKNIFKENLKEDKNIYHIKERVTKENIKSIKKSLEEIIGKEKLEVITNDMNISPYESVNIIKEFLEYLPKEGKALITLKDTKRNILNLLKDARVELEKDYNIIKIKHLE